MTSKRLSGMVAVRLIAVSLVCGVLVSGCSTSAVDTRPGATPAVKRSVVNKPADEYEVFGRTYKILPHSRGYLEIGVASWYGEKFQGRLTANGETYDMHQLTAAHKSLPLPTYIRVTNLDNGRKTIVRVNDRGPFHDDRLVDLSFKAAMELGLAGKGVAPVVVEALDDLNYPELAEPAERGATYYLQLGAFLDRARAQALMDNVIAMVNASYGREIGMQILESQVRQSVLHKVWMGPMANPEEQDQVAMLVEQARLGRPVRIRVD